MFKFVLKRSEKTRVDYGCPKNILGYPNKLCPWRVFGSLPRISQRNPEAWRKDTDLRLQQKQCVFEHKCLRGGDNSEEVVNRQSWLQRNVPKWMPAITITTDVKTIQYTMSALIGQIIHYEAARLLEVFLVEGHLHEQVGSMCLPSTARQAARWIAGRWRGI